MLVVDDDLACRVLAALFLENAGYSPTAVGSVDRALERFDEDGADVVLTDLLMPERSGLDLLLALRERRARVPIVVVTGSDDAVLLELAVAVGAHAIVHKPYGAAELAAAAADALALDSAA